MSLKKERRPSFLSLELSFSLAHSSSRPVETLFSRCTKEVTNFEGLFADLWDFNEPLTFWNTSAVVNMQSMFEAAESFDQDLSNFDMSHVTNANSMFKNAYAFRGLGLENWDVHRITVRTYLDRPLVQ